MAVSPSGAFWSKGRYNWRNQLVPYSGQASKNVVRVWLRLGGGREAVCDHAGPEVVRAGGFGRVGYECALADVEARRAAQREGGRNV